MVRTPLDTCPRKLHQMYLWPRGRRNLGPLQGVPPVRRTGHPHRLEPNPHNRTARRMADAVPGNQATRHHPQGDGGTRGGPQGTRPHSRLHLATDAFPWGAWPRDAAVDTHKQAGRQSTALTGAPSRSCHVTKRFRILATLKQGNKSMYRNISGYVHMGFGLDWGKVITGQ